MYSCGVFYGCIYPEIGIDVRIKFRLTDACPQHAL